MHKKAPILIIILIIIVGAFSVYNFLQQRGKLRQERRSQKAPQFIITLLEGWTNEQIADYLTQKGITSKKEFLTAASNISLTDFPILKEKPKNSDLQGFLYPDTYFIPKNAPNGLNLSDIVIKKSLENFTSKINEPMVAKAKTNGLTFYQTLILASIIEKETGRQTATQTQKDALQTERRTIAGIFYNRLKLGMPLQSDATVNYITKKNLPRPTQADLEVDSPYNTYKYKNLPPEPISNPSLSSIQAALNPVKTDYLYYLHDQITGRAVYAKTYEEHLANKQKYLK